MKRILITGMSGTGKSTVIRVLREKGYHAVDADENGLSALVPAPGGELTGPGHGLDWVWQPDRIQAVLDDACAETLFLGGTSPNQGEFARQFDAVIVLTAPKPVIAERLRTRTSNDFGKHPEELANTMQLIDDIEPQLLRSADLAIDTTRTTDDVVDAVLEFVARRV